MSKADNKELEKAIKCLEKERDNYIEASKCGLGYPSDNREHKEKAKKIETVLKELKRREEDYIAKDKIIEKIEELEKGQVRVKNNRLIYSREDVFRFQIYILEELLNN